jgi:hypothetical protein
MFAPGNIVDRLPPFANRDAPKESDAAVIERYRKGWPPFTVTAVLQAIVRQKRVVR